MSEDVEVVQEPAPDRESTMVEPGKLMRIALMLREMQEEVRRAPTDEAGRERLKLVHERALGQLCEVLSGDLQKELSSLTLPFDDPVPSESVILIAQAQLIGWLEGLFQGIQAAIFTQQAQARQQLDAMRQRGLPVGDAGPPGLPAPGGPRESTGQYL